MSERVMVTAVPGSCGVSVLYYFEHASYVGQTSLNNISSGAGWCCAGFVNTPRCKRVYKEMCEKYKLVYQTPVRVNRNSGRPFFFAVWDLRS